MPITKTDTGRGDLFAYTGPQGRSGNVMIPLTAKRRVELTSIADHLEARITRNESTYLPEVAPSETATYLRELALETVRTVRSQLNAEFRNVTTRRQRLLEPTPLSSADTVFERDYVARLERMSPSERIAELVRDDLDVARTSAVMRHGDLQRLISDPAMIAGVERQHIISQFSSTIAGDFPVIATPDNPLPVGADSTRAREAATAKLTELENEIEAYQDAGRAVIDLVNFAAVCGDLNPQELMAEVLA